MPFWLLQPTEAQGLSARIVSEVESRILDLRAMFLWVRLVVCGDVVRRGRRLESRRDLSMLVVFWILILDLGAGVVVRAVKTTIRRLTLIQVHLRHRHRGH